MNAKDTSSNPDEPNLRQSISTLTDWNQIEKYLLPKIYFYRNGGPRSSSGSSDGNLILPDPDTLESNAFCSCSSTDDTDDQGKKDANNIAKGIHEYLLSRLNLPVHAKMTDTSVMNSLKYCFYSMRCGIYVHIKNNKLVIFCPFVNKNYTNNWQGKLKFSGSGVTIEDYYRIKNSGENFIPDVSKWWANGNIICSQHCTEEEEKTVGTQWWGDHFLFQLKDMLADTCNNREVPDCEFFLNKRDYPQLKFNDTLGPVEPYGFIFDKDDRDPSQDIKLDQNNFKSYAPILSFYSSDRFADIPFPTSEDWEAATGMVFPSSLVASIEPEGKQPKKPRDLFTSENLRKFEYPWGKKVPTAFFRGTATGGGVTVETNQRIHIAQLSYEWGVEGSSTVDPHLDAKLTGWNWRDKKIHSEKVKYINKKGFPFVVGKKNFTPIYEQSKFKYLVYIEGHCAACRYGFMMCLGSVILKVDSKCVADKMWYFPLLRPYHDHVPVKADLSDLKEKIEWCRANDDKCEVIANNAKKLYEQYICREGILDYVQLICYEISKRFYRLPNWCDKKPIPSLKPPSMSMLGMPSHGTECCRAGLCVTCEELKKISDEQVAIEQHELATGEKARLKRQMEELAANRERMRNRAKRARSG